MKRIILFLIILVMLPNASYACPQKGDVICVNGEKKYLSYHFIEGMQRLQLLEHLPSRVQSTANWDGYTAFWSIRNERFYLDSIAMRRYAIVAEYNDWLPKDTSQWYTGINRRGDRTINLNWCLPKDTLLMLFQDYVENSEIVASWYTGKISIGEGELEYRFKGGYCVYDKYEHIYTINKGQVTEYQLAENKVIEGFSLDELSQNINNGTFVLDVHKYKKLARADSINFEIKEMQYDTIGHLVNCKVKAYGRFLRREKWRIVKGIDQEMKNRLIGIYPWHVLCVSRFGMGISSDFGGSVCYPLSNKKKR